MRRGLHLLIRLFAGLVALIVVILGLLAARLAAGPVSLAFLVPSLTRVIEGKVPLQVDVGDVHLIWRAWQNGLLLEMNGVQLHAADGTRGRIDTLAAAFSPAAMLAGTVAPSIVIAHGAEVTLIRNPDGTLALPDGLVSGDEAAEPSGSRGPLTFLRQADIRDVTVNVDDRSIGSTWSLRLDSASATREQGRLQGQGALTLAFAGETATVQGTIEESAPESGEMHAALQLGTIRPAALAPLLGSPSPAMALDLPMSGQATLTIAADGTLAAADASIDGGEGALVVTPELAKSAGMPALEQRLPVHSLALQGSYAAAAPEPTPGANPEANPEATAGAAPGFGIVVRKFELAFAPGTQVRLPPPIDQPYPLAAITAAGRYQDGKLAVTPLTLDVGGPRLTATAAIDDVLKAPSGTVDVTLTPIDTNDLRRLWPSKLAPGGYKWVTEHLHEGTVTGTVAHVELASRDGVTDATRLAASFDVQGLTVDYRPPMPVVRNVRGRVQADLTTMVITVDSGESHGLSVRGGTITLRDLDRDPSSLDIDTLITGPVRNAMEVVWSAPIDIPRDIVLPQQFSGMQTTRLRMSFPLLDDINDEDIRLLVETDARGLGIADLVPGIDVTDGHVQLRLDTETLQLRGPLAVAGILGVLDWRQALDSHTDPQTEAEFVVQHASVPQLKRHLRNLVDIDEYVVSGAFNGAVRARLGPHAVGRIEANVDLESVGLALPEIGWRKKAGEPARLDAHVDIIQNTKTVNGNTKSFSAFDFRLNAPQLLADGKVILTPEGQLASVDVSEFRFGRSSLSATVSRLPHDGWDILVSGDSLDLAPLLNRTERSGSDSATSLASIPNLTLAADLGRVWLQSDDPITDVGATVVYEHGVWDLVQMQGTLKDGSTVELAVEPDAAGTGRSLRLEAGNAGETLRVFGLYSDVMGGDIDLDGHFDDTDPDHPLDGRLRVRRFHLIKAPILARMLNLMSLTGIGDALTGRGIYFTVLDLPFSERQRRIGIFNGRTFGSMLGMTGTGTIDLKAEQVQMQGQLVPFYALNALFGRIPLLGPILTGGEEGGGLISATYEVSGSLDNPRVRVNPVSVLFPGFVRWILETVQGWIGIGNNPVSTAILGEPGELDP